MTSDFFDPFAGNAVARTAPSTDPQRELWGAVQMGDDASCAFNESISLELNGALDRPALEAALTDLISRHESLRATFSRDGSTMLVSEPGLVAVPFVDLSDQDEAAGRAALDAHLASEVATAFELESGPLYRVALLGFGPDRHWLTFSAHHIVCDGFSMGVLLRELAALYTERKVGIPAGLAPAPLFSEIATAERQREATADWQRAEQFWIDRFRSAPAPLDLPADRLRPASKTYSSSREDVELPAEFVVALKKTGARLGCTLFATLLAGFEALVHRLTGQDDIVVGIPAAGQSFNGTPGLVGHCVNTLALRSSVRGTASFAELASEVRKTMLDAYEHQIFTYGTLLRKLPLERDPARLPLASLLFNFDQGITGADLPFDGLTVHFHSNPRSFENFELFVNAAAYGERFVLECQYNSDLFDRATVRRWMAAYEELLRAVVADPRTELAALPIVPPADLEQIAALAAGPALAIDRSATLHGMIARIARERPNSIAVQDESGSLCYGELHASSLALARRLRSSGVGRGHRVGVCAERRRDLVVAVLGVLEAGGAYVPLDPGFPRERLEFYAEDSSLVALVTDDANRSLLGNIECPVVLLDGELDARSGAPLEPSALDATADDAAYVIYTSGSTGKPKGVLVPHRSVINFLAGVSQKPGMGPDDAMLAVTTLSFDIAVLELFLPLTTGARVFIASTPTAQDGITLAAALDTHGITVLQATPATWRLLLEAGWKGNHNLTALCGGEALPPGLAADIRARVGRLYNMYGPTETTVWSTIYEVPESGTPVRIGRPLSNQTTYVLDGRLQPVPFGVPGELYIGGPGVTLGYHERPELTAERFLPDPFRPGHTMYRTGDLVRLLPGGDLEYIGRTDFQVKVRGYRIELGEIEARLSSHAAVGAATVVVREDRPGDVRIVAYFVAHAEKPSEEALREHLRAVLPEYMVPQHLVQLPELPLTPNGKVDRNALPAPTFEGAPPMFIAPRTDPEQLVAAIWQEVLGLPRISVTDDFFRLGGHSLLAAQALSRLQRDHGITIGLRRVFEAPTVEKFARLLPAQSEAAAAPMAPVRRIPPLPADAPAPLSLMQQRLWFLEQFEPGTSVWNLPSAFRLHGALDVAAFERAFNTIIERHEPLRTTIAVGEEEAVQVVAPFERYSLDPIDLRALPDAEREAELGEQMQADTDRPIDIESGRPFRAALFRTGDDEYVFFFVVHHIFWDGWSFDTLLRELDVLVGAYSRGEASPLPPLPIRYRDFAAWNRAHLAEYELQRQLDFWLENLAGSLPVLDLPGDRPRPATPSRKGATLQFAFSRDEVERLTAFGQERGATLYMVLLTGLEALLHRYTGQRDLIVGTPVRGRSMPETEDLLGFFVNTIPLRTAVDPEVPFEQLLSRVRATALDAFHNQDVPLETLVRELQVARDPSRTPIYQVLFGFQDTRNRKNHIGDLRVTQVNLAVHAAPTDMYLWVKETGKDLACGLEYASDLFDESTVKRFVQSYRTLLLDAIARPRSSIDTLMVVPADDVERIHAWNAATASHFESGVRVDQLVARASANYPDNIAIEAEDGSCTYAELERLANQIARRLRSLGVHRGARVGICVERGVRTAAGLLGILRTGGAYVPLDPGFPRERLEFYAADASLVALVADTANRNLFGDAEIPVVLLDGNFDSESDSPLEPSALDATPDDAAYVLYTSGSTGAPKGVLVPHRSVTNLLQAVGEKPGICAGDALLAVTTLSFDISVLEFFLPLLGGARVVVASAESTRDGAMLATALDTRGITMMQATPATWRLLLAAGWKGSPALTVICGGEPLSPTLAGEIRSRVGRLYNGYGPTEATIYSTMYEVPPGGTPIRIGRPLPNQTAYVLDERLQLVPFGVPGELFIGGAGVALGYHNRPELTAERFLPDPFRPGHTMYRTGDLVRLLPSGDLDYIGRTDFQVKVRGFRIELGEIEAILSSHPTVREATAIVREDRPGDARIVAYLAPAESAGLAENELRKHARRSLPDYMIPQHFVELGTLPLTPNGKVDRKALPAPAGTRTAGDAFAPPGTAAERLLASLWSEALGTERVGLHDNFFNLGGHSLLCLQVVAQLERAAGIKIAPRTLVLNSLEQIAAEFPNVVSAERSRLSEVTPNLAAPQTSLTGRVLSAFKRGLGGQRKT